MILYLALGQQDLKQKKNNRSPESGQTQIEAKTGESVDWRASFAIFTQGTFRVFTFSKYHNLSDEVFIEAQEPNIIKVKKQGITWDDFFKTLPMKLTNECLTTGTGQNFCTSGAETLKFYINEERMSDFLTREIQDGDKALITYGSETEEEIRGQLQRVVDPR